MTNYRIQMGPMVELHARLQKLAGEDGKLLTRALVESNDEMARFGPSGLDNKQVLDAALTALLLNEESIATLTEYSETLHTIVEKVLAEVVSSEELCREYFPHHQRIFPFLAKTPGTDNWQVISRCDLAITPQGEIKLMELNNGCPGGYIVSRHLIEPAKVSFTQFGFGEEANQWVSATVEPSAIVDTLKDLESKAAIEPGLIAVLYDENELRFELDELTDEFIKAGREARVIDVRELEFSDGCLKHNEEKISATYNKFRVSTPDSPNHCWSPGFEERYQAYLDAQNCGAVVMVNNLCGMTIAEDKALLSMLLEPRFLELMTTEEQHLVKCSVLWTARLEDKEAQLEGKSVRLLDYVRDNKDQLVIKPANEGRGFGVLIGKSVSQDEWDAACEPRLELPCIVQEFVESVSFPVGNVRSGEFAIDQMYLTLAAANADGRLQGFVSRISSDLVTNVSQKGFGQAVFKT